MQHGGARGDARHIVHVMADDDHRYAVLMELVDDLGQLVAAARIQPRDGLVQHQNARMHGNYACQRHAAHLTAGKVKGGFLQRILGQMHAGKGLAHAGVQLVAG